jgi:hypothetical protein
MHPSCTLDPTWPGHVLLDQEEAAKDGDEMEEEQIRAARKNILADW